MPAAHDIYTEQLGELRRGHALYYPEPRPEGPVEIGDVGYTTNGAFRRLFNVSRPADDPAQRFGVPDGFVQLDMGAVDTYEAALEPGPLYSRAISTLSTEIGTPGEILPAEASFRFSCSSKRGAILMLETQMIRQEAVQQQYFETYLMQHCHSWHAFARSRGIRIGFGDLILVTECSKTAAWSSVVYSNSSSEFSLSFSVGMPFTTAGIAASNSLEKIGPVERRRSQQRALDLGSPLPKNHTVFVKGYRLGIRQMYIQSLVSLFMKAWGPNASGNRGDREGTTGVGPRSTLSASQNFTAPSGPAEFFVMRPYEPDFHASLALLALAMEKNDDSDCVVLHDNVWCFASLDSNESRIMEQYKDFCFSDEVDALLSVMSSGEINDAAIQQPPMADAPPLQQQRLAMLGTRGESDRTTDPPPSLMVRTMVKALVKYEKRKLSGRIDNVTEYPSLQDDTENIEQPSAWEASRSMSGTAKTPGIGRRKNLLKTLLASLVHEETASRRAGRSLESLHRRIDRKEAHLAFPKTSRPSEGEEHLKSPQIEGLDSLFVESSSAPEAKEDLDALRTRTPGWQ